MKRILPFSVVWLMLCSAPAGFAAEEPAPARIPDDTCVVEFKLAQGATVMLDGRDRGQERRFVFTELKAGETRVVPAVIRFADGGDTPRTLLLRGGERAVCAVSGDRRRLPELLVPTGHTDGINSVAFSSDGRHVLTGSTDRTAILWDAASGQKLRTFKGHTLWVHAAVVSPDGRQILTGSADKTAILWDLATGQKLRTFEGHRGAIYSVMFRPDGRQMLTGSYDKTAILWDMATGQKLRTFVGHTKDVRSAIFSPDGRRLLTGSWDQTAILWDAVNGQKLRTFEGHRGMVTTAAFSPDGRRVLTGSDDRTAIIRDAESGQKLCTFEGHTGPVQAAVFSPDGRQVLTGSWDKTAILWDAASGRKVRTLVGKTGEVESASFSPDGRQVLTSSGGTAILWDAASGQELRTFNGHMEWMASAVFSPDGRQVLTGSHGTAILWDVARGQTPRIFKGHTGLVRSAAFSPDGRQVLTGSWDKTAILWDLATGQKLRTFEGHTDRLSSAVFNPDGRQVLTGSADKTAILWDAASGQKLRTFDGHTGWVASAVFSPDGQQVLTGSGDTTAILWDAVSGRKVRTLAGHTGAVESVAFSRDGREVLTGSRDLTAISWDAASGQMLRTFKGDPVFVRSAVFSPDARQVLTGSEKTAVLWDAASGQKLRSFEGQDEPVNCAVFSPDGRHVLAASWDTTARLWDVATGDELVRLISLDRGQDWLVVTPEGLFDGSAGGRQKVSYRVGGGLNVVPVDRFFQDFYRPGLLAAIWRGERPLPNVELGAQRPPKLAFFSPDKGGPVETGEIDLGVEAEDQGGGIGTLGIFQNATRVLAAGRQQQKGNRLRRTFHVSLVEGENRFSIKSASADGSWEAEPAEIVLTYRKPVTKANLYLLAIGVSQHADGSYRLKFPRSDAEALVDLFRRRAPALYGHVHAQALVDEQADRKSIQRAMEDIAEHAQKQDTLLLFLAGHGTMVGQRYYFIPYDFQAHPDRSREDDIRQQGLPVDVLVDFVVRGKPLKRIVVLDTCASGGAVDLFKVASRNPDAFRGEIERLYHSHGIPILAAAAATEEAQEPVALKHGALTYALLAGLRAVDTGPLERVWVQTSNPNQVVDVAEWFAFAAGHVRSLTKQYCGSEQNVQIGGKGESFPVLPLQNP